jgi:hypothetical protein
MTPGMVVPVLANLPRLLFARASRELAVEVPRMVLLLVCGTVTRLEGMLLSGVVPARATARYRKP